MGGNVNSVVSLNELTKAAIKRSLLDDEPVVLPTETVYGLAANALSNEAVAKIFLMKERPFFDPLIVHVRHDDLDVAQLVAKGIIDDTQLSLDVKEIIVKLIDKFMPGPLTILLPKGERVAPLVTSGLTEVAVRSPKHQVFQDVLQLVDFPLAAPSANRFATTSPTHPRHVVKQRFAKLQWIVDGGQCRVGIESTVIRVLSSKKIEILRPGAVTSAMLAPFGEVENVYLQRQHLPHAPGMLDRHYAPEKECLLITSANTNLLDAFAPDTLLLFPTGAKRDAILRAYPHWPRESGVVLSESGSDIEAAQRVFEQLHDFSQSSYEKVLVFLSENESGLWAAINDKLRKASSTVQ